MKQFSFTAFCRMGDSPRFAVLPQYTNHTEPYTYYLLTPFLSQPIARHDVCMMEPNGYLIAVLATEECGLPQTESRGIAYKYLYLHFLINLPIH
ncbi:MAG: hypothetical protein MJZ97_13160 [Bacteroidales bacterium]|nr:hypothetical protein [Bacteroidales bacterium]